MCACKNSCYEIIHTSTDSYLILHLCVLYLNNFCVSSFVNVLWEVKFFSILFLPKCISHCCIGTMEGRSLIICSSTPTESPALCTAFLASTPWFLKRANDQLFGLTEISKQSAPQYSFISMFHLGGRVLRGFCVRV